MLIASLPSQPRPDLHLFVIITICLVVHSSPFLALLFSLSWLFFLALVCLFLFGLFCARSCHSQTTLPFLCFCFFFFISFSAHSLLFLLCGNKLVLWTFISTAVQYGTLFFVLLWVVAVSRGAITIIIAAVPSLLSLLRPILILLLFECASLHISHTSLSGWLLLCPTPRPSNALLAQLTLFYTLFRWWHLLRYETLFKFLCLHQRLHFLLFSLFS